MKACFNFPETEQNLGEKNFFGRHLILKVSAGFLNAIKNICTQDFAPHPLRNPAYTTACYMIIFQYFAKGRIKTDQWSSGRSIYF